MLAYVFWHRPRADVDAATYEDAQRAFHALLETPSACFRIAALPFDDRGGAYEDWYLVDDWSDLGELNRTAVDAAHGSSHDRAAAMSAAGWGGVFALVRGRAVIPDGVGWHDKPRSRSYDDFHASLPDMTIWQRQMVLGPAPEFCFAGPGSPGRLRVWPEP